MSSSSLLLGSNSRREVHKWSNEEDDLLRSLIDIYGEEDFEVIASQIPNRNKRQCKLRWDLLKKAFKKGTWSAEEDAALLQAVNNSQDDAQSIDWQKIACFVPGRSAKQCKERWVLKFDPSVIRTSWTESEDKMLLQLCERVGGKWAMISKYLPGRTENAVKNRFQTLQKHRGWTLQEDRIIFEIFMKFPSNPSKQAKNSLTLRTEREIRKRWAVLREKYHSIEELTNESISLANEELEQAISMGEQNNQILEDDNKQDDDVPPVLAKQDSLVLFLQDPELSLEEEEANREEEQDIFSSESTRLNHFVQSFGDLDISNLKEYPSNNSSSFEKRIRACQSSLKYDSIVFQQTPPPAAPSTTTCIRSFPSSTTSFEHQLEAIFNV